MSGVPPPVSVAPKIPWLLYGFVIFVLGLAIVFLINRVKTLDQRQRLMEMQFQQQTLKQEDVEDVIYQYLSDDKNASAIQKSVLPHVISFLEAGIEEQKTHEPQAVLVSTEPLPEVGADKEVHKSDPSPQKAETLSSPDSLPAGSEK